MALTLVADGPMESPIIIKFLFLLNFLNESPADLARDHLSPRAEPAPLSAGALPVLPASTEPYADRVIIVRGVEHNGTQTRGGWSK